LDSLFGIISTAAQVNGFDLVQLMGTHSLCDFVRIKGYHSPQHVVLCVTVIMSCAASILAQLTKV